MAGVSLSACATPLVTNAPAPTAASAIHDDSTNGDDDKWIWVLDPMTRKLRVPVRLLSPTQAIATSGAVPSLCIAYLEGRCRHPWCRQAHVLPSAIPQLRYEALNAPTCCHLHSDPHDISKLTNRFRYIRIINNGPNGNSELIPTERVASTVGLLRYLVHNILPKKGEENTHPGTDDVLELPAKFICRLHLAHRCRYLEDCNNIHLCREYELQLQPPPHMLSSLCTVTTSTRSVTIGDTCYTVTPLAVGEVSDDDFHLISETQRARHQASCAAAAQPNDGSSEAPFAPWAAPSAYDSTAASSMGNSPMVYAKSAQGRTPSSLAVPGASASAFPSLPEYWPPATPATGAADRSVTSFTASLAGGAPPTSAAGHLRVYDVRQRNTSPGANGVEAPLCSSGAAAPAAFSVPASYPASSQGAKSQATSCVKPTNESSSTDGGNSVSSSDAETPLKDGGMNGFPAVYGDVIAARTIVRQ